jgi:Na+-translocating ferredoxin:NAD+ oxidoreductase subunit B
MMAMLGTALAIVLAVADRKLAVQEDVRIDQVEDMLPKANCGACGTPGCRSFAEAVVSGKLAPGKCTVNSGEMTAQIAQFLGVDAGAEEKRVARLACAGGKHVARQRAQYEGLQTCRAAALISGGGKGCAWGCLGLSDCAVVCEFGAITMDAHGLPMVDEAKCTACGDCVEVCPKGLFSLHPVSHRLWVACKNLSLGEEAEAECEVACTGCARCAMDAPAGLITMQNNLAVVDYTLNAQASQQPLQRCPTGAIVWLDPEVGAIKGKAAKRIPANQVKPRLKEPARV